VAAARAALPVDRRLQQRHQPDRRLDGLATGCTITVALVFGIMAYIADNSVAAQYLLISYVPGTSDSRSSAGR